MVKGCEDGGEGKLRSRFAKKCNLTVVYIMTDSCLANRHAARYERQFVLPIIQHWLSSGSLGRFAVFFQHLLEDLAIRKIIILKFATLEISLSASL